MVQPGRPHKLSASFVNELFNALAFRPSRPSIITRFVFSSTPRLRKSRKIFLFAETGFHGAEPMDYTEVFGSVKKNAKTFSGFVAAALRRRVRIIEAFSSLSTPARGLIGTKRATGAGGGQKHARTASSGGALRQACRFGWLRIHSSGTRAPWTLSLPQGRGIRGSPAGDAMPRPHCSQALDRPFRRMADGQTDIGKEKRRPGAAVF